MANEPRPHDTQYNLLWKILQSLNGGITTSSPPGGLPVIEQGPDTPTQFDSAGLIDGFGRLRTSQPSTVLEAKHIQSGDGALWSDFGSGVTTTLDATNSQYLLEAPASTAGTMVHQTRQRAYYQAGKSQLVEITFNIPLQTDYTERAGILWEVGYGDDQNGFFLSGNGCPTGLSDVGFVRRRLGSSADSVPRANWNVDTLDGFGPSGKTLNLTAPQIMWIDAEWLGVGQVRCGFLIDGRRILCHVFSWNNVITTTNGTYMPSLSLPIRYAVTGDGSNSDPFRLACICACVKSEGGQENVGHFHTYSRGFTALTTAVANTWYPLVGIRLKATSVGRFGIIRPSAVDVAVVSGNNPIGEWGLFYNPTVAGTALNWQTAHTTTDYFNDTTSATTITGAPFAAGYFTGSNQARASIAQSVNRETQLGLAADGTPDYIILAARTSTTGFGIVGNLSVVAVR